MQKSVCQSTHPSFPDFIIGGIYNTVAFTPAFTMQTIMRRLDKEMCSDPVYVLDFGEIIK